MTATIHPTTDAGVMPPDAVKPHREFDGEKIVRDIIAEIDYEYAPTESFDSVTVRRAARMAIDRTLAEVTKPAPVMLDRQQLIEQLDILEAAARSTYSGVLTDGVNRTEQSLGRDVAAKVTDAFKHDLITLLEHHGVIAPEQQTSQLGWD